MPSPKRAVNRQRAIHQLQSSPTYTELHITPAEAMKAVSQVVNINGAYILDKRPSTIAAMSIQYINQWRDAAKAQRKEQRRVERTERNSIATIAFHPDNIERKRYEVTFERTNETYFVDRLIDIQNRGIRYNSLPAMKDYVRYPSRRHTHDFIICDNYPEHPRHKFER
ncbi:hypothetical protein [Ferrimonas lipolytica]|uniref:Uncharacterized protein n=1 Tax=Ferrimonas lipolytica TaxID=2724191 RepID=A0A6H1UJT4_9GAMM|nr:hypothetical protein [Ferrimonas lipolytica]QIZ78062.1 hypothetical protein HER31_14850 [Ferrimonas lipolytica]